MRLPGIHLERKISLLVAIIVLLFFAYWVHLEGTFEDNRAMARSAGQSRASQVAKVLEQEFDTSFRAMERFLEGAGKEGLTPDNQLNPTAFLANLQRVMPLFPLPSHTRVSLYDPDGRLLTSTQPQDAAPTLEISPGTPLPTVAEWRREPFRILPPVVNSTSGQMEMRFARPLFHANRLFGIIVSDLPASYFSSKLGSIGLDRGDAASLILLPQGLVLASSDAARSGTYPAGPTPYLADHAPDNGTYIQPASATDEGHVAAWSQMTRYPAAAHVDLAENTILADVERHISVSRTYAIVNLGLLSVLIGIVIVLIYRSERQRRSLAEQEALYHALFDQNHSIKIVSDPVTERIVEANQAACAFYGYTREAILKLHVWDINCLPMDQVRGHMSEALTGQRPFFLFPHRLASGEIRQVEVYAGPVEFQGRRVIYSIIHDVTERFRLEAELKTSEARYRTVFEVVPAGVVMVNGEGRFVAFNSEALSILTTHEEGLKQRQKPLFTPAGHMLKEKERPSWRALTSDLEDELLYTLDDAGEKVWATFNSRRLPPAPDGTHQGAVIGFSDVTEIMRQEERLLISQLVFDSTTEGIMVTDADNRLVAVNRAFSEITGYSAAEALGKSPSMLASGQHDCAFYRSMYESLATKGSWEGEVTNRHKDGHFFIERLVINAVVHSSGVLGGYVGVLSDITARKEKESQLWRQANFDALTGLPNRTLLLDRAEQALAQSRRHGQPVAILFVDLDRFKPVNDQYGHAVGDELLKAVAARLTDCVRPEDTVGRLGGDEFVVLLPMVANSEGAMLVANKLLTTLCQPFTVQDIEVSIGACVGVAMAEDTESVDAATLLDSADHAMYEAKEKGRGRVELFDPDLDTGPAGQNGHAPPA